MSRRTCLPFAPLICFVSGLCLRAAETPPAQGTPPAADQKPASSTEAKKEEKRPAEAKETPKKEEKKPEQEKEIVVTAERLPTPRDATGVAINTVTAKDLQLTQETLVGEALRYVPGVAIVRSGRAGDLSQIHIRGGQNDHTLMLYDGWKVNPAGRVKFFNFESLDPVGADRIEIARGPSSALFGSEAVTGAVNLLTHKGEGRPELTTSVAGGTYGTDRETLDMQGRQGKFSYHVSGARLHRQEATVNNSELQSYNWTGRFDYDVNEDHSLKLLTRGVDFKKGWYEDTASGFGPAVSPPDPNDTVHNRDRLIGFEYAGKVVPIWETIFRAGHYGVDAKYLSRDPNPEQPLDFGFGFGAFPMSAVPGHTWVHERRNSLEWRNNVTVYESSDVKDVITAGAYGEHEYFHQTDTIWGAMFHRHHINYAGYVQNRLELFQRAFITVGGRHEETEEFGGHDTGRADVSLLIPESDTRIHGSIGNSFRAPSFTELFAPLSGNPTLSPEQNWAYDGGIEQHFWKRRITLSATWFSNHFKDLILFGPAPTYLNANVGTAFTRGFELEAAFRPIRQLELLANATLMKTGDQYNEPLMRRPTYVYTARLIAHPLVDLVKAKYDGLDISLELLSVGKRVDTTLAPNGTYIPKIIHAGYERCDLALSYRFFEHFRAFARFQNLLDKKYEDVLTFPADGANVLGGLEFQWRF